MARLIPTHDVDSIELKPERDVARALTEQLVPDCLVYHSYPWLRPLRNDRGQEKFLREGEADFVVLDPARGFLVLEVKGGVIAYDADEHRWYRVLPNGERREITDPLAQARKSMHELCDQVMEHSFPSQEFFPCTYGYAVLFPDCTLTGPPPPGGDHSVLLGAKDLPFLSRRLADVFGHWSHAGTSSPMALDVFKGIRRGLSRPFNPIPLLARQVEAQEEVLVRLTKQQEQALMRLYRNDRVLVQGSAGSGKTLLALMRAQRYVQAGQTVLFLCFNKGLAEWLRQILPAADQERITVRTFNALCSDYCRRAGLTFQPPSAEQCGGAKEFWQVDAANLLNQALERVTARYQAVVVDEAQDFYPNWWMPIELLNANMEDGPLYVFFDPDQNLFLEEGMLVLPDLPVVYELTASCRNTRRIAQACGRVLNKTLEVFEDAPEGMDPMITCVPTAAQRRSLCEQQVREWVGAGKLRPRQIAVLSPWTQANSSLAGATHLAGAPLVSDLAEWREDRGILFATIRAFKGLEADALLLTDVPAFSASFSRSDLYVAYSRAKHLLRVLATVKLTVQ